jgi:hypothetical protein
MRFDFYGVFFESHPKHVREAENNPNKSFDVAENIFHLAQLKSNFKKNLIVVIMM